MTRRYTYTITGEIELAVSDTAESFPLDIAANLPKGSLMSLVETCIDFQVDRLDANDAYGGAIVKVGSQSSTATTINVEGAVPASKTEISRGIGLGAIYGDNAPKVRRYQPPYSFAIPIIDGKGKVTISMSSAGCTAAKFKAAYSITVMIKEP